jgi:hypothetical protein
VINDSVQQHKQLSFAEQLAAARNHHTQPELLEELSTHRDWAIRACVAKNHNTSLEILQRLSNDNMYWVRDSVIVNPNTPKYLKHHFLYLKYLNLL